MELEREKIGCGENCIVIPMYLLNYNSCSLYAVV